MNGGNEDVASDESESRARVSPQGEGAWEMMYSK
jgi:hypothetical protein